MTKPLNKLLAALLSLLIGFAVSACAAPIEEAGRLQHQAHEIIAQGGSYDAP